LSRRLVFNTTFSKTSRSNPSYTLKMLKLQLLSSSRRTSTLFSLSNLLSLLLFAVLLCSSSWLVQVQGFVSPIYPSSQQQHAFDFRVAAESETGDNDPNEIVARRISLEGDVAGGYYRSCVRNEAGRFRRLCGTMTPPDDSRQAEIYVEVCITIKTLNTI